MLPAATGDDIVDVVAADLVGTFPAILLAMSVVKVGYIGNPILRVCFGNVIAERDAAENKKFA